MVQVQHDTTSPRPYSRIHLISGTRGFAVKYPEDAFPEMVKRAKALGYNFPYLHDETQQVARAYGAQRTPHVFVLDGQRVLRYTGRIDDNWESPEAVTSHDLRDTLDALLEGRPVSCQTPAVGCTVKWK